ncbi:potassium channel family protein [Candidatus Micrarchaeota archaeon]|nr:potassium channel family protein [Candidatus Micrarchaeota archaeon]
MASGKLNTLFIPLILLTILYIFAIIFFHFVEGWSFLDATYFTTMTISTVGYGDIIPTTELGKVGTILLVFAGVSLAFYLITTFGVIREKKFDPHIQKRLDVLRSITTLQTKKLGKHQLKHIKNKMRGARRP